MTKEAMTQPEQEPVGYEHHEYRPFGAPGEVRIHAVLASQYKMPDGTIAGDFGWLIDLYRSDKNTIKLEALYTAPPQRKPLTDEQIMAIGRELGLKCKLGGNQNIDFDYARAIEAAHGIKE